MTIIYKMSAIQGYLLRGGSTMYTNICQSVVATIMYVVKLSISSFILDIHSQTNMQILQCTHNT